MKLLRIIAITCAVALLPATALADGQKPGAPAPKPHGSILLLNVIADKAGVERPKEFQVTMHEIISGLKWHSWGGAKATAKGDFETNTCDPSCVAGNTIVFRNTVFEVQGSKDCKGQRYYAEYRLLHPGLKGDYASYTKWAPTYTPCDFK